MAQRATFSTTRTTSSSTFDTNLNVGRNPEDTLRVLDALQTDELCFLQPPSSGDARGGLTCRSIACEIVDAAGGRQALASTRGGSFS